MARVNVEEESLPRVAKLAGIMGVSDREALGTVAWAWHDSQDVLAVIGSREDIIDWCHLYGLDDKQINRWLSALERSRFISRLDDGTYKVHGNDIQIEGRVSRLHQGAKGGAATKKKWEAIKEKVSKKKTPDVTPTERQANASDHQGQSSSVQCSSIQINPVQGSREPKLAAPEEKICGSPVWKAYSSAYEERYGEAPPPNAKSNSLCLQLVKRLGGDEAPEVARFYVGHNAPYYVSRGHPLSALIADAEKIRTEWKTGKVISPAKWKTHQERVSDANRELFEKNQRGEL